MTSVNGEMNYSSAEHKAKIYRNAGLNIYPYLNTTVQHVTAVWHAHVISVAN